jgi:hypothetical protein
MALTRSSWAASPSVPVILLLLPLALWAALLPPGSARAAEDSLRQSMQELQRFPFRPDCDGNTQEIVACHWRQRNRQDATLERLLGSSPLLEGWRASRRRVCETAAAKALGGSIHPIVWLRCENQLNATLIEQIRQPLVP